MPITDMLYGVLFRPVATFGRLAEEKPLARAVGVWSLALVFTALVNAGIFRGQLGSALPFPALTQAASNLMWLYGLMYVLFSLALWFVISAVYTVLGNCFWSGQWPGYSDLYGPGRCAGSSDLLFICWERYFLYNL